MKNKIFVGEYNVINRLGICQKLKNYGTSKCLLIGPYGAGDFKALLLPHFVCDFMINKAVIGECKVIHFWRSAKYLKFRGTLTF